MAHSDRGFPGVVGGVAPHLLIRSYHFAKKSRGAYRRRLVCLVDFLFGLLVCGPLNTILQRKTEKTESNVQVTQSPRAGPPRHCRHGPVAGEAIFVFVSHSFQAIASGPKFGHVHLATVACHPKFVTPTD